MQQLAPQDAVAGKDILDFSPRGVEFRHGVVGRRDPVKRQRFIIEGEFLALRHKDAGQRRGCKPFKSPLARRRGALRQNIKRFENIARFNLKVLKGAFVRLGVIRPCWRTAISVDIGGVVLAEFKASVQTARRVRRRR